MLAAGIAFAVGWAAIATLDRGFERKWRWLWIRAGQDLSWWPRAYEIATIWFPVEREDDLFGRLVVSKWRARFWFQLPTISMQRPRLEIRRGDRR